MFKFIIDLLFFVIWCVLLPIDFLCTICSADNCFHKWMNNVYHKHVRTLLTGNRMSRTSYTLSHDFFLLLVFCIISAITYNWLDKDKNVMINKYIRISVTSPTNDTIKQIDMNLNQEIDYKEALKLDSKIKDTMKTSFSPSFTFVFYLNDDNSKDTAEFEVSTSTNFDASFSPDTTNALSLSIVKQTSRETIYYVSFNQDERKDGVKKQDFRVNSDVHIFDDPYYPYVNFYMSIDKDSRSALAIDEELAQKGEIAFDIKLNSTIDSLLFGDMPYDVVSVKPEPDTNNPYHITFTSPDAIREVLNKGIFISTVNRDLKAKQERNSFIKSVLFGAFVSLILGIIITLLTKWRNLSRSIGRKNPYD